MNTFRIHPQEQRRSCNLWSNLVAIVIGKCTGMDTRSCIDDIMINMYKALCYPYCDAYPVMPKLNNGVCINKTNLVWYPFISYATLNLGLQSTLLLYRMQPSIKRCKSRMVSMQRVKPRHQ